MVTTSKSSNKQEQKSLTNADDSILSASGGSTVYDLSQIDGAANLTVNGITGGDMLGVVNSLLDAAGSLFGGVVGGIQDQVKAQSENINSIAATATGTQTELERIINKMLLPGFLVVGGIVLLSMWRKSK